ncbi:hypothetical protein AH4AK4_1645 [Aeromonas hydrophila 4AK4]|nr:hypothetical protein AH4AK4_1645 [Aeromonas hydrophila 4AK4]
MHATFRGGTRRGALPRQPKGGHQSPVNLGQGEQRRDE